MFLCRLGHKEDGNVHSPFNRQGRPVISPYPVVLPATRVFKDPQDFLLPLLPYAIPPIDNPDERIGVEEAH